MKCVTMTLLLFSCAVRGEEPKLTEADKTLLSKAEKLDGEAMQLYRTGRPAEAAQKYQQVVASLREVYSKAKYPNGHAQLAQCLNNLGTVWKAAGNLEKARQCGEEAVDICRKLYPKKDYPAGHISLALCLNNLGSTLQTAADFERARTCFEEVLTVFRGVYSKEKFPAGHPNLALGLNNIGYALLAAGKLEEARTYFEQSLNMFQSLFPKTKFPSGHPQLALGHNNLGYLLMNAGDLESARPHYEQALAMFRLLYPKEEYPDGHPDLSLSLNNVGTLFVAMGNVEAARPYLEQALAMRRTLYPKEKYSVGHAELIDSLNALGALLQQQGQLNKARALFEQAVDMSRTLFPKSKYPAGHPTLAESISNFASLQCDAGEFSQARTSFEQSLAIYRDLYPNRLYPAGHTQLALILSNIGGAFWGEGNSDQALIHFDQALVMRRALYPKEIYPAGHPQLAESLNNLGFLMLATGKFVQARLFFGEALAIERSFANRIMLASSESECLAFLQQKPLSRDGYLSIIASPDDSSREDYAIVWRSQALVTRLLEQRHSASRAADVSHSTKLARLRDIRHQTELILQKSSFKREHADSQLTKLAVERDTLERELAATLPITKLWSERDKLGPIDLAKFLSSDVVFINLIAYTQFVRDQTKSGPAGEKRIPSYLAFVVTPSAKISRVDLGPAAPIDSAIAAWRNAVQQRESDRPAADKVASLLWSKLAPHVPPASKTVYLAVDGDLARIPWAALPIGSGRVLLEDYAVATVPHGQFLLEHLKFPRQFVGPGKLLAVGRLEYGSKWPALAGTKVELDAIVSLAPSERETASHGEATADRVAKGLSKARYAHIATHGEFRAEEFAAEKKRELDARKSWVEGQDIRRVAAKNPLGFVGLVLSGGEVMSGLSILDLNLDDLKLVTLSACETGLGEYTGGKGVENLQMAFHIAGAENVVASLWKVNDAATAALMAKFYHEMWVRKKEPLAALREAQLTIYRHPELIPDLAGERGAPKAKEALAVKIDTSAKPSAGKHADTKLWAAFVLSGVGK